MTPSAIETYSPYIHAEIAHSCKLPFVDSVVHLGHTLRYDLNDSDDIFVCLCDFIKKANCMLHTFLAVDPLVKIKLFQPYCLSLYDSSLWKLSCREIKTFEVAFNKILRRIIFTYSYSYCSLPSCKVSLTSSLIARLLLAAAKASPSDMVFSDSSKLIYTSTCFNTLYGQRFCNSYSSQEFFCRMFNLVHSSVLLCCL